MEEWINPVNYITSLIIGILINILEGEVNLLTPLIILVPLVVEVFSKSIVNYLNREKSRLMMLPGERENPTFLMDGDGDIMITTGRTQKLFNQFDVLNIRHFLNLESCDRIFDIIQKNENKPQPIECYSDKTEQWYKVLLKKIKRENEYLVWFDDITERKRLVYRLNSIRAFSTEVFSNIKNIVNHNDTYERLANLILSEGYHGVLIAEMQGADILAGRVYKKKYGNLLISEHLEIAKDSSSPIWSSRRIEEVVSADYRDYSSSKEFMMAHPFDGKVQEFLNFPVINYVNYHQDKISIIAFNKDMYLTLYDKFSMETMVNTAMTVNTLVELAIVNDEKFLQSVEGLCSAAEFSDEMTGEHILRVNLYATFIADKLGKDEAFCRAIGQVSAMHDIGKVAIPHLIKMTRAYNADERLQMQMHTIYGAQILDKMMERGERMKEPRLGMARRIALHHHQLYNGKGYPGLKKEDGSITDLTSRDYRYYSRLTPLAGDEIPLEALIVSLADKYDALRSERHYKPAFSHEKTIAMLRKDDFTGFTGQELFGPHIFELFLDYNKEFERIYNSMRENGTS